MPIIATAGHVDHGKSALVEALTGRDPDRWEEEKRRGLTIDLGFAWATIGGVEVGFVDVPGHERFVKNMLAGVGAVDLALFVVAADEGWMPQSEEHLAVLDTLGIDMGVIALTRCDLVDPDLVDLAAAEVAERTAGTTLEPWPIIPVSARTRRGLPELTAALGSVLAQTSPPGDPDTDRRAWRMWIDRAFVVGGAGLVVTGTPVGGTVRRDDMLELWPGGASVRVRAVQVHEERVETAAAGNRTALNLVGVERIDVARGAVLGPPGGFHPTRRVLARLRPTRAWPEAIGDRGAYHLHVGTGHWPVQIRLLEDRRTGGRFIGGGGLTDPGPAVLRLEEPLPLRMGDRFVLRDVGRRVVVGGGVVLDPHPRESTPRRKTVDLLVEAVAADPDTRATALLAVRDTARTADITVDSAGGRPTGAVVVGDQVFTSDRLDTTLAALRRLVAGFHAEHPLRPGIPKATLASAAGITPDLVELVVAGPGSGLVERASVVVAEGFTPAWGTDERSAWEAAEAALRGSGLSVPRVSSLGLDPEVLHTVIREGRLVIVGDDVGYLPEQLDDVVARLETLPDRFTVAEFRDALGLSRRQAVPLLEWLDAAGHTRRSGDVRELRRPPPTTSDAAPTR